MRATSTTRADAALRRVRKFLQLELPHVPLGRARSGSTRVVEKTIWGSPAGKKRLAGRLVKMIPAHKTYVEPFAGSGAVFFAKPKAETEVLADADPEIAFAFKTLATLTDRELASLAKMDWTGRERIFARLKTAKPKGKVEKLYRFLYLSHFAYGALRGKSYDHHADGIEARTIPRIEKHRDRLRGVTVRSAHYADVVKEFDGKDTFFFLDPPYPGYNVQVGENKFDEVEFRKVLDGIKGKFLVTYGARGKLDTKGFHVKKIRTPRTISSMRGVGGPAMLTQLLISNYAITQKSLGPYPLDEVEEIDLSADVAMDLEYVRILAKALTETVRRRPFAAVVRSLERIQGGADERAEAIARRLLPVGDRLVRSIEADVPAIARVLRTARPALAELAGEPVAPRGDPFPIERETAEKARLEISAVLEKRIPLLKTDEERYVLGIVLEPETVDAQQDIYAAAEVRDAAHRFMAEYRNIGHMHQRLVNGGVKILESYLAPTSFDMDGTSVKKGTWLLAVRVLNDELWGQIKAGELQGLSIGGSAVRAPRDSAS